MHGPRPCSADLAPTYVLSSPVPDQLRSLCTPPTPTCDTLVLTNRICLIAQCTLCFSHSLNLSLLPALVAVLLPPSPPPPLPRLSVTARFILVSSLCFPPPPSSPLASRRSPAVFSAPSCPATCTTLLALPNDPTPTCDYRTRLPVSCPTVSMQPPLFLAPQLNAPHDLTNLSSSCTARDLVQLI